MLLGFLVAAVTMTLSHDHGANAAALPIGLLLVGLPAFDVALVMYSRRRRGVSILTAGRDHLSHRLLTRVGSPRHVAAALAIAQGALAVVAIGGHEVAGEFVWFVAAACVTGGLALIPVLESRPPPADEPRPPRLVKLTHDA
jgi:UDP-N-acetylmuramyl pentapeptide phosphotransferase/UDP-N-acetylglucosamine-1-phosphate transferase